MFALRESFNDPVINSQALKFSYFSQVLRPLSLVVNVYVQVYGYGERAGHARFGSKPIERVWRGPAVRGRLQGSGPGGGGVAAAPEYPGQHQG